MLAFFVPMSRHGEVMMKLCRDPASFRTVFFTAWRYADVTRSPRLASTSSSSRFSGRVRPLRWPFCPKQAQSCLRYHQSSPPPVAVPKGHQAQRHRRPASVFRIAACPSGPAHRHPRRAGTGRGIRPVEAACTGRQASLTQFRLILLTAPHLLRGFLFSAFANRGCCKCRFPADAARLAHEAARMCR